MALTISGTFLGNTNITSLSNLSDVSITSPLDGQYLRYNSTLAEWQNVYLDSDIFNFLDSKLSASNGVVLTYNSGSNSIGITLNIGITGDVNGSLTNGTLSLNLNTVNTTPGTFGSSTTIPTFTVNSKGIITSISEVAYTGAVTSATNIQGGTLGAIPYQASANITTFLPAGSSSQVLISGPAPSWSNTPTLTGTNFVGIPNSALLNNYIRIGSTNLTLGSQTLTLTGLSTVTSSFFQGTLTGNASSASSLQTARAISSTGDATWTVSFNGLSDVSGVLTLATVNTSPVSSSFEKITVNGKGLVTSTTSVVPADIISALGYTPINKAGDTMAGPLILNADPTNPLGAATKQYVDTSISGLSWKESVMAATTGNITLSGLQTIDGYTTLAGDRILVKDQTNQTENGIYNASASTWTRSSDAATGTELIGASVYIEAGTTQKGSGWVQSTTGTITIGTTPIVWVQFSGVGVYLAGTGLSLSANTFSNTGVLSVTPGSGISTSAATGNITVTNTGVLSVLGSSNIAVSTATGNVTISLTGTVPTATTATNLAGGAGGSIPYQTNTGLTGFLAPVAVGQVLISGTFPSWSSTPTFTGTNITGIPNGGLINNSVTIGTTNIALGGTTTTLSGLTSISATTFTGTLNGNATTATTATNVAGSGTISTTTGTFSGNVQSGGKFLAAEGAGTVGGYSFTLDTNQSTGMFSPSSGNLQFYANGVDVFGLTSSLVTINRPVTSSAAITASSFSGAGTGLTGTASALSIGGNAATTSQTNFTNLTIGGSQVLDAANFNTYAPTLTGTGASGTWGISITGNSATTTKLQTPVTINGVSFDGSSNITISSTTANTLTFNNSGNGIISGGTYDGSTAETVSYNTIGSPSVTGTNATGTWPISITGNAVTTSQTDFTNLTIGGSQVLDAATFNTYAPTLTGTGASGTWGINISGNAATATTATNLSGGTVSSTTGTFSGALYLSNGSATSPSLTFTNEPVHDTGIYWATDGYMNFTNNGVYSGQTGPGGTLTMVGTVSAASFTGAGTGLTGTASSLNIGGNSATTTKLQTPVTINGVSFDGSSNITVSATTANALTFDNTGAGVVSGSTFNGSTAETISYNTVGAPSITGTNATGTWPISITGNAVTTSQTDFTNLTIGGSQVLDAANFNSYAPTLTGGGASGTWGINISGNAATTSQTNFSNLTLNGNQVLDSVNFNTYAPTLTGGGASGSWAISVTGSSESVSYTDTRSTDFAPTLYPGLTWHLKSNATDGLNDGGSYHGTLNLLQWSDLSGGLSHQLGFTDNGNIYLRTAANTTTWGNWVEMLSATNYGSYAPTLTGGGASGTWPIAITGNAATATVLQTSRTINGVSFNGSANITITANTPGSLTFNNGGAGASSGTVFNGSTSDTISYNTIGAPSVTGTNASGTWPISISGTAATTSQTNFTNLTIGGSQVLDAANFNTYAPTLTGVGASGTWPISITGTSSSTNQTNFTNLTIGGSQVLDAANFNTYAPTLTGGGASGTWGISITGNAATATTATTATTANALNTSNSYQVVNLTATGTVTTPTATIGTSPEQLYINSSSSGSLLSNGATYNGTSWVSTNTSGSVYGMNDAGTFSWYSFTGATVGSAPTFVNSATLDASGNFTAAGNVTAYSDGRLKYNVKTITDALSKTMKLRGVTYTKDNVANIGVIAQEVQEIIPEVVHIGNDKDKTLSVAYGNMVGLLIEAIKELKAEVDELKEKILKLS